MEGVDGWVFRDAKTPSLFLPGHIEPKTPFLRIYNVANNTEFLVNVLGQGKSIILESLHYQNENIVVRAHYINGQFRKAMILRFLENRNIAAGFEVNIHSVLPWTSEQGVDRVHFSTRGDSLVMNEAKTGLPLLYAEPQGVRYIFGEDFKKSLDVNFYTARDDAAEVGKLLWKGIDGEKDMIQLWDSLHYVYRYLFMTPAANG